MSQIKQLKLFNNALDQKTLRERHTNSLQHNPLVWF